MNNVFLNYLRNTYKKDDDVKVDDKYMELRDFYIRYTIDNNRSFDKYRSFRFVHNLNVEDVINGIRMYEGCNEKEEEDEQVRMYNLYKKKFISKEDFDNNIHDPQDYFKRQISFNTFSNMFKYKNKSQTQSILKKIEHIIQNKPFDYEYYQYLHSKCKFHVILNFFNKNKIQI